MTTQESPKSFRYSRSRLHRSRTVFESPQQQKQLNTEICCTSYDDAPMLYPSGRISVMTRGAEDLAKELVAKGWLQMEVSQ
jgi:hypothetical protein